MKNAIATAVALSALFLLGGCMTTPTSIVTMPMSARPLTSEQLQAVPSNGAIYQASAYRPVFEDRRARHIGDVLTLVITERTSANKTGASSGNKTGGVSVALPKPLQSTFGNPLAVSNESSFSDGDNQSARTPLPAPWASPWSRCWPTAT